MIIGLGSDLHLEFGDLTFSNTENADVLILGGDICVAKYMTQHESPAAVEYRSHRFHNFFQRCAAQFPHVIYIAGNHEHYNGDFAITIPHLKEVLEYLPNLHVLEKETLEIDDITFICGTLWTDMNGGDPTTIHRIKQMMNDFQIIKNSNRILSRRVPLYKKDENGKNIEDGFKFKKEPSTFSPEDACDENKKFIDYITTIVEREYDKKFVVVGHHAPSKRSIHVNYKNDTIMNGGYVSDHDEFILNHPQIKLWTHGHIHHEFDYMIGLTRVVCNPRGYIRHEQQATNWKLKYFEV